LLIRTKHRVPRQEGFQPQLPRRVPTLLYASASRWGNPSATLLRTGQLSQAAARSIQIVLVPDDFSPGPESGNKVGARGLWALRRRSPPKTPLLVPISPARHDK